MGLNRTKRANFGGFVQWKRVLLISCVFWFCFQNAGSQFCFRVCFVLFCYCDKWSVQVTNHHMYFSAMACEYGDTWRWKEFAVFCGSRTDIISVFPDLYCERFWTRSYSPAVWSYCKSFIFCVHKSAYAYYWLYCLLVETFLFTVRNPAQWETAKVTPVESHQLCWPFHYFSPDWLILRSGSAMCPMGRLGSPSLTSVNSNFFRVMPLLLDQHQSATVLGPE